MTERLRLFTKREQQVAEEMPGIRIHLTKTSSGFPAFFAVGKIENIEALVETIVNSEPSDAQMRKMGC